jgi:hypothetical protein
MSKPRLEERKVMAAANAEKGLCPCGAARRDEPNGNSILYACWWYNINQPSDCQSCPHRPDEEVTYGSV